MLNTSRFIETPDWSTIPAPTDDGGTRHLAGMRKASVSLQATDGTVVDLSIQPGRVVVYAYPHPAFRMLPIRTGGRDSGGGTARVHARRVVRFATTSGIEITRRRAVFGLSTQDTAYQREAAERLHCAGFRCCPMKGCC